MFNSKYSNFLTVLLVISIIAIVVLIGYFAYDIYRKYYSNKKGEDAVDAFQSQFINNTQNSNEYKFNDVDLNNDITNEETDGNNTNIPTNPSTGSSGGGSTGKKNTSSNNGGTTNKYEGYTMLGTIEISKINLKTPILKELSTDSLKKATILIYGNLNENAVIIGHNNRNGTFFSNLKKLSNGDIIRITDSTGEQVNYAVYSKFEATPDDTSFYQRNTNGLREISLSTCTDNDDTKRIIVLAREV